MAGSKSIDFNRTRDLSNAKENYSCSSKVIWVQSSDRKRHTLVRQHSTSAEENFVSIYFCLFVFFFLNIYFSLSKTCARCERFWKHCNVWIFINRRKKLSVWGDQQKRVAKQCSPLATFEAKKCLTILKFKSDTKAKFTEKKKTFQKNHIRNYSICVSVNGQKNNNRFDLLNDPALHKRGKKTTINILFWFFWCTKWHKTF